MSVKYIPPASKRLNFLESDSSYKYNDIATNKKKWIGLWNLSAEDIHNMADQYISNYTNTIDKMLKLPEEKQSYKNTILQIDDFHARNDFDINRCIFLQNVSKEESILNVSSEVEKQINIHMINTYMRRDLYKLAKAVYKKEKRQLHGEDLLYLTHILSTFKRNGLQLDNEKYTKIRELSEELTVLSTEYSMNIAKDDTSIKLSIDELDGLPAPFIESLEKDSDGRYKITTKYPHIHPIYNKATSAEVRKKIELMCTTRCPENISLLFKIITIRRQIAELLGYASWAEYVLELNMAKNVETVNGFLYDLVEKLKRLRNKELDNMVSEKHGVIESYDWRYYLEKEKYDKYNIDTDIIREYFPLEHVLRSMFKYFADLLQITFTKVDYNNLSQAVADGSIWHQDVLEYKIYNRDSQIPIGTVYLDLFPRPNKFTHAACFPLMYSTKSHQYAICAIVCNFTPDTEEHPALLSHEEVETFYHEFGHAMHNICSSTYYVEFSGTQTDRDFVEMPSQMVENWCWEFNTIKQLGVHYKTGDSMPDDMVAKLIATRYIGSGIINCRQLVFSIADMILHTNQIRSEQEMLEIFAKLSEDIMGIPEMENTHRLTTFGHIAGGYDAQYYGYMWSKVYADDIYAHLKDLNAQNIPIGNKYRDIILSAGGAKDALKLVKQLLGRAPSNKAFLHNLGL